MIIENVLLNYRIEYSIIDYILIDYILFDYIIDYILGQFPIYKNNSSSFDKSGFLKFSAN